MSVYEEIQHPNLDKSVGDIAAQRSGSYLLPDGPQPNSFSNGCFAKWFVNFDEKKLRPFLIRNYSIQNVLMQDAINELITKEFDDNDPEEV